MIYADFAYIYDSLMYDFDYNKVFNFINGIYSKYNINTETILELACGTGTLTNMCSDHYKVDAFDISPEMLSIAQNKIYNMKNVRFFNQDMRNFNMHKKYDSCLCVCDSLNYLTKSDDFVDALKNVFEHLDSNGVFIFDLNTIYKFENMENNYVDEVDEIFYVWENYFDKKNLLNTYGVNFFIEKDNGLYERFYEEHIERAYSIDFVSDCLAKIGFKDINIYDDYTVNLCNKETSRAVFVARR